jgi:ankyrin repeat protein
MGCSQSKARKADAVVDAVGPPPESTNDHPTTQKSHKNKSNAFSHSPTSKKSTKEMATSTNVSLRSGRSGSAAASRRSLRSKGVAGSSSTTTATEDDSRFNGVYKILAKVKRSESNSDIRTVHSTLTEAVQSRILKACETTPAVACYQNPTTKSTPLHMAVRLLDYPCGDPRSASALPTVLQGLIRANPDAVRIRDATGHIPLHYAVAPTVPPGAVQLPSRDWKVRAEVLQLLLAADIETSMEYFTQTAVIFQDTANVLERKGGRSQHGNSPDDAMITATPFYHALLALPDDFDRDSPTVVFSAVLKDAFPNMVQTPNAHDGDTPLALLYRRFTRQFDLAEKFFAGDNSRPEVVEHRRRYKTAAGNTWKIIECLLRPEIPNTPTPASLQWRLLHRAVEIQTPPDLLRYIVETNAEDLQQPDSVGNLPIHYAAASNIKQLYYSKFVTDELLYKYPESAAVPNSQGQLALTLAVATGKPWIGGGLQSLYDAYPKAMAQVDLEKHEYLRKIVSDDSFSVMSSPQASPEEKKTDGSKLRDEHHDAIMLVQQKTAPLGHIINAMWAHEEDAGLQMLACVSLARQVRQLTKPHRNEGLLRIALPAVSAVVNAMKAHPNEVIVQEKACHVLTLLAPTDGQRELSFVASGAVAAIVGALQAHVR